MRQRDREIFIFIFFPVRRWSPEKTERKRERNSHDVFFCSKVVSRRTKLSLHFLCPKVIQTYETSASWDAPGDGKYYVTVVAFNSAIEASAPACSDGVTVDSTRPEFREVFVSGARIAGGVVSARREEREEVWFVDSERRRRLVDNPDQDCL